MIQRTSSNPLQFYAFMNVWACMPHAWVSHIMRDQQIPYILIKKCRWNLSSCIFVSSANLSSDDKSRPDFHELRIRIRLSWPQMKINKFTIFHIRETMNCLLTTPAQSNSILTSTTGCETIDGSPAAEIHLMAVENLPFSSWSMYLISERRGKFMVFKLAMSGMLVTSQPWGNWT